MHPTISRFDFDASTTLDCGHEADIDPDVGTCWQCRMPRGCFLPPFRGGYFRPLSEIPTELKESTPEGREEIAYRIVAGSDSALPLYNLQNKLELARRSVLPDFIRKCNGIPFTEIEVTKAVQKKIAAFCWWFRMPEPLRFVLEQEFLPLPPRKQFALEQEFLPLPCFERAIVINQNIQSRIVAIERSRERILSIEQRDLITRRLRNVYLRAESLRAQAIAELDLRRQAEEPDSSLDQY